MTRLVTQQYLALAQSRVLLAAANQERYQPRQSGNGSDRLVLPSRWKQALGTIALLGLTSAMIAIPAKAMKPHYLNIQEEIVNPIPKTVRKSLAGRKSYSAIFGAVITTNRSWNEDRRAFPYKPFVKLTEAISHSMIKEEHILKSRLDHSTYLALKDYTGLTLAGNNLSGLKRCLTIAGRKRNTPCRHGKIQTVDKVRVDKFKTKRINRGDGVEILTSTSQPLYVAESTPLRSHPTHTLDVVPGTWKLGDSKRVRAIQHTAPKQSGQGKKAQADKALPAVLPRRQADWQRQPIKI